MSRDGYSLFIPEWRMRLALLAFMALIAYCAVIELEKSRKAVEGMEYAMREQFDDVEPRQTPSATTLASHHSVDAGFVDDEGGDAEDESEAEAKAAD